MSRIQVTRSRSGPGCGWILSVPLLLIGTLLCGGMIFFASIASEASDRGELQQRQYTVEREGVEAAQLDIRMEAGEMRVTGLNDSASLIDADLTWRGDLEAERIDADGHVYRIVQQTTSGDPMQQFFRFINVGANWDEEPIRWEIGLNDSVPFTLDIHNSAGLVDLDLRAVTLDELTARVSAGELRLMLPEPETSYEVNITNNVGSTQITLPPNTAVEIVADIDMGEIHMPTTLIREQNDERNEVGESGVWRSEGFDDAAAVIRIHVEGGMGELIVE